MAQKEKNIQNEILLACSDKDTALWSNIRGLAWLGEAKTIDLRLVLIRNARQVKYGVGPNGASDIIGFKSIEITPDMVGKRVAVFTALEIKTETGKPSAEQVAFNKMIEEAGGISGIARTPSEAKEILKRF